MTRRGTTVSTHVTKYTCLMDELVRLSHQAAFHFFSLLFSNEELDQGEREVHGGAGPARGPRRASCRVSAPCRDSHAPPHRVRRGPRSPPQCSRGAGGRSPSRPPTPRNRLREGRVPLPCACSRSDVSVQA